MKNIIRQHTPVIGMMAAMLCGNLYGVQPAANFANTTTGALQRSNVRPEDLLWSSAQECLKKVQYKEAREKFDQFAAKYRNDKQYKEALFYQGLCEMKLGKESQAQNTWDRVLKQELPEKTKSQAWLLIMEQLALWYGQKGKDEDQKKALKQVLAEFPDSPITVRLHTQTAEARLKASDYAGALGFYRAVEGCLTENDRKNLELAVTMTTKGGSARELLTAANESLEKNDVEQAINLYQAFLKENAASPLAVEAKTKLGWCFYLKRDYDKAEMLCKEVIKAGPLTSHWVGKSRWYLIVLAAGPQGKVSKAIELCDAQAKAFDGDQLAEQAMFTKAWLYWTQKEWARAKTAFDELLAKYPARGAHPPVKKYIADCENGLMVKAEGRK